jgi:hypothetical protein
MCDSEDDAGAEGALRQGGDSPVPDQGATQPHPADQAPAEGAAGGAGGAGTEVVPPPPMSLEELQRAMASRLADMEATAAHTRQLADELSARSCALQAQVASLRAAHDDNVHERRCGSGAGPATAAAAAVAAAGGGAAPFGALSPAQAAAMNAQVAAVAAGAAAAAAAHALAAHAGGAQAPPPPEAQQPPVHEADDEVSAGSCGATGADEDGDDEAARAGGARGRTRPRSAGGSAPQRGRHR